MIKHPCFSVKQTLRTKVGEKLGSIPKEGIIGTFLVANAFVWYLTGFSYLQEAATSLGGNSLLYIVAANFVTLALSALVVTMFVGRLKQRLLFLKLWMLAGAAFSILFVVANFDVFLEVLFSAGLIGMYFGVGMPVCMDFFAKTTEPQNRGKFGGIVILLIGIGFPLISIIGGSNAAILAGTLAVWRMLALVFTVAVNSVDVQATVSQKISFRAVLSNKTFLLYVTPWFMFSLINDLTMQLNASHFAEGMFGPNYMVIENVVAGFSAIVCGFVADKKGRKRLALMGFALLGLGYASLGLFGSNFLAEGFYIFADGIAWGSFSMLFLITIWGDIAEGKGSEKFYFLGVLPYLFSDLARLLVGSFVANFIQETTIFSLASLFLFVAILPLVNAPETVSEKLLKDIDLSSYVEKAMRKATKESSL